MKPATDPALQRLVIYTQIAEIQAAIDEAFDTPSIDEPLIDAHLIQRKVAHGRAPIMCNGVEVLPARKKP